MLSASTVKIAEKIFTIATKGYNVRKLTILYLASLFPLLIYSSGDQLQSTLLCEKKNLKNSLPPRIRNIWYALCWFKITRLVSVAVQPLSTCKEFLEFIYQDPGWPQKCCFGELYGFGYKFNRNSFNLYEQEYLAQKEWPSLLAIPLTFLLLIKRNFSCYTLLFKL